MSSDQIEIIKSPVLDHHIMKKSLFLESFFGSLCGLGIVACLVISTSAQSYSEQFSYQSLNDAFRKHTYKSPGSVDIKSLAESESYPPPSVVNPDDGFRDWLFHKARENMADVKAGDFDGFAETPLGNISQTCYDDVMTFFADTEAYKTYAMKSKFFIILFLFLLRYKNIGSSL